jgi:para-aminobenzoate synthetase/4-amino-4-deoxychorismate lyase
MRYENGEIKFLEQHLARIKAAADYFLFKFSEKKIRKQIVKSIAALDEQERSKIRLTLNKWGEIRVELSHIPNLSKKVSVIISQNKINSTDKFRNFKTTNRKLYDDEYSHYNLKGVYEVLYLNEKDEIAEGSRTNIFFRKGSAWFTPDLDSGALPGIYRNYFIQNNLNVVEKNITVKDVIKADELLLTNALRGEVKVNKLFITSDEYITFNN